MSTAVEIAAAFHGTRNGRGFLVRCPLRGHGRGKGDRHPSLSVCDGDDGRLLVRCFAGCDSRDVLAELRRLGLDEGSGRARGERPVAPRKPEPVTRHQRALEIWRSCRSAEGSLAESYLRSRGLSLSIPPSIKFHARLRHTRSRLRLPCMVAALQDCDGRLIAIHRTFLSNDGRDKAAVKPNRMMLGPCAGGAVRFAAAGRRLAIGEGIQSSLSVHQADPDLSVWAALSTSGMRAVAIPEHVQELVILADGDEPGEMAARALAARRDNAGRLVRIARPPAGQDFNDLLLCGPATRDAAHA